MSIFREGLTLGLFLALTYYFYNSSTNNNEKTLVTLKLGKIRGSILKTYSGKNFFAFRGIPYAKPPIGQLRFKPTEKLTDPWPVQPFNAMNDGPVCIQYDAIQKKIHGQEDCLVLNVYTSEILNDENHVQKKAVMVLIHGGGFNYGTAISTSYGPKKLLDHDVILVTFNYRLNIFGFLSTKDEVSPGNYGLLDQVMALEWVQENIEAFGGDPNKVTIFGESAGGASVSFHLLSELSSGLFRSAIVMSGSSLAFWALDYKPLENARKFASLIGCETSNSSTIVECLRQHSLDDITKLLRSLWIETMIGFRPVVDGKFLKEHPLTLYKFGRIVNQVPLIFGKTKNEGLLFYYLHFANSTLELSDSIIKELVAFTHKIDNHYIVENDSSKLLKSRYFQSVNSTDFKMIKNIITQIFTHSFIDAPFYYNLEFYLKSGMEPFLYSFDYFTNNSVSNLLGVEESEPTHIDDLYFLFDGKLLFPYDYVKMNDEQEETFLAMWVNFAKNSNPTPENHKNSIRWLPVKNGEINICHLDNAITLQKLEIDNEIIDFWMKTLPKIIKLNITSK